eukprot:gene180-239_t
MNHTIALFAVSESFYLKRYLRKTKYLLLLAIPFIMAIHAFMEVNSCGWIINISYSCIACLMKVVWLSWQICSMITLLFAIILTFLSLRYSFEGFFLTTYMTYFEKPFLWQEVITIKYTYPMRGISGCIFSSPFVVWLRIRNLKRLNKKKREFLLMIAGLLLVSVLVTPYPILARWFGFMLASYSAIANDSIQTIGTFIASNVHRKWWYLWLFMGLIFIATITYSWVVYQGDVSYQRLTEKGFSEAPEQLKFLQLLAPIILLMLTHWRIPVSTSFLLLNVFATDSEAVYGVLKKSLYGYAISFIIAGIFWYFITKWLNKPTKNKPWWGWDVIQWIVSGLLWSVWLMQDASNIAVFLPRQLNVLELLLFISFIFFGLGLLFYLKGDKMQRLINEKSGISDVKAAMMVNLVYMLILFYFKNVNNVPLSTTWVFIGLLGGREIAISLTRNGIAKRNKALKKGFKFIKRDLKHALIGLLISITLALCVNDMIRDIVLGLTKKLFN